MHATRKNLLAVLEQARRCVEEGAEVCIGTTCTEDGKCLLQDCVGTACVWQGIFTHAIRTLLRVQGAQYEYIPCLGIDGMINCTLKVLKTATYLLSNRICSDVPLIIAMIIQDASGRAGAKAVDTLYNSPRLIGIKNSYAEWGSLSCDVNEWIHTMPPDIQTLHAISMIPGIRGHLSVSTLEKPAVHEHCVVAMEGSLNAVREKISPCLVTGISRLIADVRTRIQTGE